MADKKLALVVSFLGQDRLSGALRNIVGGSKAGASSMRALSARARDLRRELSDVARDLKGASGSVTNLVNKENRLEAELAAVNRQLDRQKSRLTAIGNLRRTSSGIASGAGTVGAASSVAVTAPLVAFGRQAFIAAMDAEELRSAFNVTFGANARAMEAWAARSGAAMGRTNVEMMKAANTFGIFFNQADPAKSAAMSRQFSALAQDLASFYNVDPGTALEKLRSGLTGESEPMRDFGVFMTDAAVKAQAFKMGLAPVGAELTEQQKIMARAGLIMAQTTNAQGDLARTSGSTANRLRAASSAYSNLSLVVGTQLIPALTPAIITITRLIQSFTALSPATQKWLIIAAAGAAVFGPIMLGVAGIASAVSALAPALVGARIAFMFLARGVMQAGLMMLANPMVLAIVAIGVALGALAYLVYANWGRIRAAFSAGWQWVKDTLSAAPGWLASLGGAMMSGLLSMIDPFGLRNRLLDVARNGVNAFKAFFGIKSPSRLMMAMGGHMTAGLAAGIDGGRGAPLRSMGRMATAVAGAGALSLAGPSFAAPSASGSAVSGQGGRGGGTTINITIQQQPGEDAQALAERVASLLDARAARARRASFQDDF